MDRLAAAREPALVAGGAAVLRLRAHDARQLGVREGARRAQGAGRALHRRRVVEGAVDARADREDDGPIPDRTCGATSRKACPGSASGTCRAAPSSNPNAWNETHIGLFSLVGRSGEAVFQAQKDFADVARRLEMPSLFPNAIQTPVQLVSVRFFMGNGFGLGGGDASPAGKIKATAKLRDVLRENAQARLRRLPRAADPAGRRRRSVLVQQPRAAPLQRDAEGCHRSERHPVAGARRRLARGVPVDARRAAVMRARRLNAICCVLRSRLLSVPALRGWRKRPRPSSAAKRSSSTPARPATRDGVGDDGRAMLPGTDALRIKYQGALPALIEKRTDLNAGRDPHVRAPRHVVDAAVSPDRGHRARHPGHRRLYCGSRPVPLPAARANVFAPQRHAAPRDELPRCRVTQPFSKTR